MRIRTTQPGADERAGLWQRHERVQDPDVLLKLLRRYEVRRAQPTCAECTWHLLRDDRFILRADTTDENGVRHAYALKGFVDERGEQIHQVHHALAVEYAARQERCPFHTPIAYAQEERLLISDWVEGSPPWADTSSNRTEILKQFAVVLAHVHSSTLVPEPPTLSNTFADFVLHRCGRLRARKRWRETWGAMDVLMPSIAESLPHLDETPHTVLHGDPKPEHFLQDRGRLVLLDLDSLGYGDPAYDVGYFLAQLHLEHLSGRSHFDKLPEMLETFRSAYAAARPGTSSRNISFYYGLTLARKCYNIVHEKPANWKVMLEHATAHAVRALGDMERPPDQLKIDSAV